MKIDERIRTAYERQYERASRLKIAVDRQMRQRPTRWHYESRLKDSESFALKIESGRARNPDEVEDTFACVLVVPNFADISEAEVLATSRYNLIERRPRSSTSTSKTPTDFRFDDLRLYLRYEDNPATPPTGLDGLLFEIQVRTFLQHAWSVATHDVNYKSKTASWRRERIAHHARAALEQTEVTIENMATLENSQVLPEQNQEFERINAVISLLASEWSEDQLPRDIRRLAEGVCDLASALGRESDPNFLPNLLVTGRARYGGSHNLDWSPYRAILTYLTEQYGAQLTAVLSTGKANRPRQRRVQAFVYPETLSALSLDAAAARGVIALT